MWSASNSSAGVSCASTAFMLDLSRARALSGINTGSRSRKLCHNTHPTNFRDQYTRGCVNDLLKAREQPVAGSSSQKPQNCYSAALVFFWSLCKPRRAMLIVKSRETFLISRGSRFRQARTWILTNTGVCFCKTEVYPFLAPDLSISIYSLHSDPCWKMHYILTVALCEPRANGSRNSQLRDIIV